MNLKQNKPKNTRIQKGQKKQEKRDYLQDLYGTPELTTTEYNQKLQGYLNGILNEKNRLNEVTQ